MKYYAFFVANNGCTYNKVPYIYANKRDAIANIKKIVKAEHFQQAGNESRYMVRDENGICVAAGTVHGTKMWWSVDHDVIGTRG